MLRSILGMSPWLRRAAQFSKVHSRWYGCPVSERRRAVELLGEHHARERVRQRERRQAQQQRRLAASPAARGRRRRRSRTRWAWLADPLADLRRRAARVVRSRPRSSSATQRAPSGSAACTAAPPRSRAACARGTRSRAASAQPRNLAPLARRRSSFATRDFFGRDPRSASPASRPRAPRGCSSCAPSGASRAPRCRRGPPAPTRRSPRLRRRARARPAARSVSCTLVGERLDLARRIAARDHDALEERRQALDVEDHDVAPLDVLEGVDHGALLLTDVHTGRVRGTM